MRPIKRDHFKFPLLKKKKKENRFGMVPCTEVTGSNSFFFYNVLAEIFSIKRKSLKLEVPLEIVGTKNTPLSFPLHQDY